MRRRDQIACNLLTLLCFSSLGCGAGDESDAAGTGGVEAPDAVSPDADGHPDLPARPDADIARAARKPTCPTDLSTCVEVAAAVDTSDACRGLRWVGRLNEPQSACPSADGVPAGPGRWESERLFGDEAPAPLRAYCAYFWSPPDGQEDVEPEQGAQYLTGFSQALPGAGQFAALTKDCMGGGAQNSLVTQEVGPLATDAYYEMVGQVQPLPDSAGGLAPPQVRVAVADSSPHGYDQGAAGIGQFDHGLNVGRIVRKIACPGDGGGVNCIGQVSNHLALPQVKPAVRDLNDGGYFGYQSQLAASIYTAVRDWQLHNAGAAAAGATPHERLVINLSVGWEPVYGGTFNRTNYAALQPHVRSVYEALMHASCMGALVFAAAGNDPGGPNPTGGAIYPAAWEAKAAPSFQACRTFEGASYAENPARPIFPIGGANAYRPLLYAVSGVGHNDFPLANSRLKSAPRLVAPGHMAATRYEVSPGTWEYTQAMTGSSAAAGAASGAAAAVWGYRPELRPYEVAQLLYDSAVALDGVAPGSVARKAEVCMTGFTCSALPVKRLNVCQALRAACPGPGPVSACFAAADLPDCGEQPGGLTRLVPAYTGSGPDLSSVDFDAAAIAAGEPVMSFSAATLTGAMTGLSVCKHGSGRPFLRIPANTGAYPVDPCPLRQYYTEHMMPWVGPQPTTPICVDCNMGSGITVTMVTPKTVSLRVLLDNAYATSTISNGILEILNGSGVVVQSYYLKDLGLPGTLVANTSYTVPSLTLNYAPTSSRLTFSIRDSGKYTWYTRTSAVTQY